MAKKMWNESDAEGVKKQIEAHLKAPYRCLDGSLSPAQSWVNAFELATSYKLDIGPPPTTATKRVEALRAAGAWEELNEAYRMDGLSLEHDRETRAMSRWLGLRKWAAE